MRIFKTCRFAAKQVFVGNGVLHDISPFLQTHFVEWILVINEVSNDAVTAGSLS